MGAFVDESRIGCVHVEPKALGGLFDRLVQLLRVSVDKQNECAGRKCLAV